jgi:hypothetical protein
MEWPILTLRQFRDSEAAMEWQCAPTGLRFGMPPDARPNRSFCCDYRYSDKSNLRLGKLEDRSSGEPQIRPSHRACDLVVLGWIPRVDGSVSNSYGRHSFVYLRPLKVDRRVVTSFACVVNWSAAALRPDACRDSTLISEGRPCAWMTQTPTWELRLLPT